MLIITQKYKIPGGYHSIDALWEEEPVVECVHGVVLLDRTLPLQQDWSSVQSIISPEHCEASFLVTVDQGPVYTHNVFNLCLLQAFF